MEEDDYAVKAAREWIGGSLGWPTCGCDICEGIRAGHADEVRRLAAIIRKHVAENIDDINGGLMRG